MSDEIAIKVDNVSKNFRLPHEKNDSIKSAVINFYRQNRTFEKQEALKDVSFEVKKGEFFGIVGRNGSGKSTLLKMLAGIYSPTKGAIQVNGKLTPFIELGVGFSPELTGRENVFLNGALLGFNRKEMNAMYKDIVEFAELERFMDQKLKNYSSGMQVRLAFSIAIRAKSDILLIDEVLAVGDESFQAKCLNYFQTLKREKKTVIFVSHDMSQVKRFCDKALAVDRGELLEIGTTERISELYQEKNINSSLGVGTQKTETQNKLQAICDKKKLTYGETVHIGIRWELKRHMKAKNVGVSIFKDTGEYIFGANTAFDKVVVSGSKLDCAVVCSLPPASYTVAIGLFGEDDTDVIDYNPSAAKFAVMPSSKTRSWQGLINLSHAWKD